MLTHHRAIMPAPRPGATVVVSTVPRKADTRIEPLYFATQINDNIRVETTGSACSSRKYLCRIDWVEFGIAPNRKSALMVHYAVVTEVILEYY